MAFLYKGGWKQIFIYATTTPGYVRNNAWCGFYVVWNFDNWGFTTHEDGCYIITTA